jgi:hypothetical protein
MAGEVPQEHERTEIRSVAGGINTRFALTQLQEDEVADMENFHIEARGGVEKRKGYTPHVAADTATTNAINGLWKHKDPTTEVIVRVEGGDIDTSTMAGGAWSAIEGTETISSTALVKATMYRKNSIITDGVNVLLKWDGTGNVAKALALLDAGPDTLDAAYTLVRHQERIVVGNTIATLSTVSTTELSALRASKIGTLDSWEGDGDDTYMQIEEGDGDKITNLVSMSDYLVVFKENSLHRIIDYGITASQTRKKIAEVGTPGKHTTALVGPFIFFLDVNGRLWVYDVRGDNDDSVIEVSAPKLGKSTFDAIDSSRMEFAHLHYEPSRQELWAFMTEVGQTETNIAWVYNIVTGSDQQVRNPLNGAFYKMRYADPMNIAVSTQEADGTPLFLGGTDNGLVQTLNETKNDDGTTFTPYFESREMDLGVRWAQKGLEDSDLFTRVDEGQVIKMTVKFDFQDAGDEYNVVIAGQGDTLG